jgi:invasion protein IalB
LFGDFRFVERGVRLFFSAILLKGVLLPVAALAGTQSQTFQDWEVTCVDTLSCTASSSVVAADGTWLGTVRLRAMDEAGQQAFQVIVPAGVHLASGLFVELPGQMFRQATFIRCEPRACEAQLVMTAGEFATWLRGDLAEIRYRPHVDVRPVAFTVSLSGITAATEFAKGAGG